VVATLALPAAASAAPPLPFGHACLPQSGVLLCPTAADDQRVPTFDGVPLDVDVTLPSTGDGPFPTIVILHGLGGKKSDFEALDAAGLQPDGTRKATAYHNNNVFYAQRGYAVVNYSARGFGRSCGTADSRTSPGCDKGWVHLADQRYEGRDTQYLLGLLADQGVTQPKAIGIDGESYGGGTAQALAKLRNRIRQEDGTLAPWTSPSGRAMSVGAVYSRWSWSDLTLELFPNGRFLDFRPAPVAQTRSPIGVDKKSFVDGLFLLTDITGFLPPAGANPDLRGEKAVLDSGEPYEPAAAVSLRNLSRFNSAAGIAGGSAPLLVQNGWRDELAQPQLGLLAYNSLRTLKGARVSLQLGDVGHSPGTNKLDVNRGFNDQAAAFFDFHLRKQGKAPANGSVLTYTTTCPKARASGGPFRASSWKRLHPGAVRFGGRKTQKVTSTGGNPATAKAFDQRSGGDACKTVKRERARGTAVYQRRVRKPFTLLGLPTVRARVRTKGRNGQLDSRLWDVSHGQQRLVSRGVYRLRPGQKGLVTFQLFGNGYRVARGHTLKLELLGRDPDYLRPSNGKFSVRVSKLTVELPTRERPGRRRGISRPRIAR
jgi:predicted acyl esterase